MSAPRRDPLSLVIVDEEGRATITDYTEFIERFEAYAEWMYVKGKEFVKRDVKMRLGLTP